MVSSLACWRRDCPHPAEFHVSAVTGRGKVEFAGFSGGAMTAPPRSSTGTETCDVSEYACEEHSTRSYLRSVLTAQNAEDRRLVRAGLQEESPLGPWRVLDFKRERLPH